VHERELNPLFGWFAIACLQCATPLGLPFHLNLETRKYEVFLDQYNKRYELSLFEEMLSNVGNNGKL
jgi:hypothetical protein